MVQELEAALRATLAQYVISQQAHWNIQCPTFFQWHDFLGDMYDALQDGADLIAESMRTLGVVVPFSYPATAPVTTSIEAVRLAVMDANQASIAALQSAIKATAQAPDIQNMLQDRLAAHRKWAWMMQSAQ